MSVFRFSIFIALFILLSCDNTSQPEYSYDINFPLQENSRDNDGFKYLVVDSDGEPIKTGFVSLGNSIKFHAPSSEIDLYLFGEFDLIDVSVDGVIALQGIATGSETISNYHGLMPDRQSNIKDVAGDLCSHIEYNLLPTISIEIPEELSDVPAEEIHEHLAFRNASICKIDVLEDTVRKAILSYTDYNLKMNDEETSFVFTEKSIGIIFLGDDEPISIDLVELKDGETSIVLTPNLEVPAATELSVKSYLSEPFRLPSRYVYARSVHDVDNNVTTISYWPVINSDIMFSNLTTSISSNHIRQHFFNLDISSMPTELNAPDLSIQNIFINQEDKTIEWDYGEEVPSLSEIYIDGPINVSVYSNGTKNTIDLSWLDKVSGNDLQFLRLSLKNEPIKISTASMSKDISDANSNLLLKENDENIIYQHTQFLNRGD